jgi:hypothetical protein
LRSAFPAPGTARTPVKRQSLANNRDILLKRDKLNHRGHSEKLCRHLFSLQHLTGGQQAGSSHMRKIVAAKIMTTKMMAARTIAAVIVMLASAAAIAHADQIRIGVGTVGPISPQAMYQIEQLVGAQPNVHEVPIVPPGDVDACVKRFVAGEKDDQLDGIMVVSLPTDKFLTKNDQNEATFTGSYEIWVLNLSTLAEDRHAFTFEDREPVIGGVTAILTIPAQFLSQAAGGGKLVSSNVYQAYESVQNRVEAKLVAATRLYLSSSPLAQIGPLDPLETAQALIDRGDGETAMAVFKSVGVNNPRVQQMMAAAEGKLKQAEAAKWLGRTLGAMAGDDPARAGIMLATYEKSPAAQPARVEAIRRVLATYPHQEARSPYAALITSDVPGLDHSAFVAMLTQLFNDETGSAPDDVIVGTGEVKIQSKDAPKGLKTHLDAYARALGRSAWAMSIKCGCAANATLQSETAGAPLLRARFEPSFTQPEVGLP